MKKWATSLSLLITALASAALASPEGRWGVGFQDSGIQFDIVFTIGTNQMNVRNTCSRSGQSVSVDVTVPSSYTSTTLTVQGRAQKQVSQNGLNCEIGVEPDSVQYRVAGNQLILTNQSGEQFALDRR